MFQRKGRSSAKRQTDYELGIFSEVIAGLNSFFIYGGLEGARGFARLLGVNSKKTTKHVFNKIFLTV